MSSNSVWSEKIFYTIYVFLNLFRLNLLSNIWSILQNVLCELDKICILLFMGRVSCIHLLDIVDLLHWSSPLFPNLTSVWFYIIKNEIFKPSVIIVELSISSFSSINFCSIYVYDLLLDVQIFIAVTSSCCIETFVSI